MANFNLNKVILGGRLTSLPELKKTNNGTSVTTFTIAVNRKYAKDQSEQQTDFINCQAWRNTAEFICKYFTKGSMIAVVGSIQTRTWDGQDGKKQYATEVVVDEAYFTGSRNESGSQGGGFQSQGFDQGMGGGFNPQPQTSSQPDFGADFDMDGFADLDGSEDDLPF